jgi:hypothetical protein
MKSLIDYTAPKLNKLYIENAVYFDGSSAYENAENLNYIYCGLGMNIPAEKVDYVKKMTAEIHDECIELDIKINGREAIILRELEEYECFKTNNLVGCIRSLSSYNIQVQEIMDVFNMTERVLNIDRNIIS